MNKIVYVIILALCLCEVGTAQVHSFRVMCYNTENLFDYKNDSVTADDEFTPNGERAWTYKKYKEKLAKIGKVIIAVGEDAPPTLVGLCEIENEEVLKDLTQHSPIKNFNYQYIHYESPDARGIDVALLYQRTLFKPISSYAIKVNIKEQPDFTTRDILYVKGSLLRRDTLHVFICHFPSRLGGELESEYKRINAARILKHKTDSILSSNSKSKIIIMGDFNDYPSNKSIVEVLEANNIDSHISNNNLYNLMSRYNNNPNVGTHKFHAEWGCLDQIIVSGALLNDSTTLYTKKDATNIYNADFLLENDEKYLGKKPFRTFVGYRYHGGFSDHLPIYLDLHLIKY